MFRIAVRVQKLCVARRTHGSLRGTPETLAGNSLVVTLVILGSVAGITDRAESSSTDGCI